MSFHPISRTLMGPGPSDVNPRITQALARPTIGHLDPQFIQLMDDIKVLLQYAFQTNNVLTLPISAPGSAGMEASFVNLIEPGDKVIVCQNGAFGLRMKENVLRCGAHPIMLEFEWGKTIDINQVESTIKSNPESKAIAFVHAETSTGVQSDAHTICQLAKQHGLLSIVDTVTGLGGIDVNVDHWQADAVYSGSQKCLSCVPGLSPITFSESAQKAIQNRATPVQSWFLDMNLVMGYWGEGNQRAYHHTAPINALYALHEALSILQNEGLKNAWQRHQFHHMALRHGLEALGLNLLVDEQHRLPQLNAVTIPNAINEAQVRAHLLNQYNLEIGAGLGSLAGKVWRIGLMGYGCNESNVRQCLSALESALLDQGFSCSPGKAISHVNQFYSDNT